MKRGRQKTQAKSQTTSKAVSTNEVEELKSIYEQCLGIPDFTTKLGEHLEGSTNNLKQLPSLQADSAIHLSEIGRITTSKQFRSKLLLMQESIQTYEINRTANTEVANNCLDTIARTMAELDQAIVVNNPTVTTSIAAKHAEERQQAAGIQSQNNQPMDDDHDDRSSISTDTAPETAKFIRGSTGVIKEDDSVTMHSLVTSPHEITQQAVRIQTQHNRSMDDEDQIDGPAHPKRTVDKILHAQQQYRNDFVKQWLANTPDDLVPESHSHDDLPSPTVTGASRAQSQPGHPGAGLF